MIEEKSLKHYEKYKETYKRYYEKNKEKKQKYNSDYYRTYRTNPIVCACGKNVLERNMRFHQASKYHLSRVSN
jgi:hypothetical protein